MRTGQRHRTAHTLQGFDDASLFVAQGAGAGRTGFVHGVGDGLEVALEQLGLQRQGGLPERFLQHAQRELRTVAQAGHAGVPVRLPGRQFGGRQAQVAGRVRGRTGWAGGAARRRLEEEGPRWGDRHGGGQHRGGDHGGSGAVRS